MNITKSIFCKLVLALIFSVAPVIAVAETVSLEPVECMAPGLYEFQSVKVSVGPEESSYNAGDTINFLGELINENSYPVVDGNVFVRISKNNENYITEGHNAVEEIVALQNVMIDAGSTVPVEFSWKIPAELGAGDYRADYFFSVGKKFNLGGLPFTNEIKVGFANFEIKNDTESSFVLDRSQTKVNGEPYTHIGGWPFILKDQSIEFSQSIRNFESESIIVSVDYELYYWDSLNEKDKIDSKTEKITIPANSSVDLKYLVEKASEPAYYLKIKATSGGETSIVNLRTGSDITRARINYPAITNFPIKEGETTKLFSCFHTAYGVAEGNKLILTLSDKKGNEIVSGEYSTDITTDMSAAATDFVAENNYKFIKLEASIVDKDGTVVDSYENIYDCSLMNSAKCQSIPDGPNLLIYGLIFLLIGLVALLISRKTNNPAVKKVLIALTILLIVMSIASFIAKLFDSPTQIGAEDVTNGGRTKTDTRKFDYDFGYNASATDHRRVAFGSVNYTYNATLNGGIPEQTRFRVRVGEEINFSQSQECEFNSMTGMWDTPYCGETEYIYGGRLSDGSDRTGWVKISVTGAPTYFASSSNSPVAALSCNGMACTGVNPGLTSVYVNFTGAVLSIFGAAQTDAAGGAYRYDLFLAGDRGGYYGGNSISLGGYNPSWIVEVYEDGVCGSANLTQVTSQPTGGAACQTGNVNPNGGPADTPGTFNWSCDGRGGASVVCVAGQTLNGVCGTANNGPALATEPTTNPAACNPGVWDDDKDSETHFKWQCNGVNGGRRSDTCSVAISTTPQPGACGGANGSTVSAQPTGLAACSTGAYSSSPDDSTTEYLWSCLGTGGNTVNVNNCHATKQTPDDGDPDGNGNGNNDPRITTVEIDNDTNPDNNGNDNITSIIVGTADEPNQQCVVRWDLEGSASGSCEIRNISGGAFRTVPYSGPGTFSTMVDSRNEYTVTCTDANPPYLSDTSTILRCVRNPSIIEE